MKTAVTVVVVLLIVALVFIIFANKANAPTEDPIRVDGLLEEDTTSNGAGDITSEVTEDFMGTLKLTSSAFEHNSKIPSLYTCDSDNVNPPLSISSVPKGTQSLALIMDDPDVPKNLRADGMWDHWVVFNVPPTTTEILEGEEPEGIHGIGTSENSDYNGPCPPDREHRYFFKLYALDVELNLEEGATKKEVEEAMEGHVLQETILVGLYERK